MNKTIARIIIGIFLIINIIGIVHAEQVFDYAKNPPKNQLYYFQGGSNEQISTTSTSKTGYFTIQTGIQEQPCGVKTVSIFGVTLSTIDASKGTGSCYNVSPLVFLNIALDNPDYGLIPFATQGDYNAPTGELHISVIPYNFNIWQGKDYPSSNNKNLVNSIIAAVQKDPGLLTIDGSTASIRTGDIGYFQLDQNTFSAYYEWKIRQKEGVCSDEVITGLFSPNTYYSHPERINYDPALLAAIQAPTVGQSRTNALSFACRNLMFPSSVSTNSGRVNQMFSEYQQTFYSLYYDERIQYQSYPMSIQQIDISCYNNGSKVGADQWTPAEQDQSNTFIAKGNGQQTYTWSNLPLGRGIESPQGWELQQQTFALRCPAGTNFYTASVMIEKNTQYRHISPLDYTWLWSDIFNKSSTSALYPVFTNHKTDGRIILTQTGLLIPNIALPTNNSFPLNGNPDINKLNETNSTKYTTGINGTTLINSNSGGKTNNPCLECQQNITGYGNNGSASNYSNNGGGGVIGGGSSIGSSIDDSAVGGLMQQSKAQQQVETKQSFIESLIQLGSLLFSTVTIFAELIGLVGMIALFFMFFSIPTRMKETIKELFNAGTRK